MKPPARPKLDLHAPSVPPICYTNHSWQRGEDAMPQWLSSQLMRAFQQKDLRQIRLLNDCWFIYRTKEPRDDSATTV